MATKIISRRKTPKTIEALLRNVGIVKKTPQNRGVFVQRHRIEKNRYCEVEFRKILYSLKILYEFLSYIKN